MIEAGDGCVWKYQILHAPHEEIKVGKGRFHELWKQLTGKIKSLEADFREEEGVVQQLRDALAPSGMRNS